MKGIRKLFLGLVFMTLFCVGFKIEAKALTPALSVCEKPTASSYKNSDFSKQNSILRGYFESTNMDAEYPDIDLVDPTDPNKQVGTVIYRYDYEIYDSDNGSDPIDTGYLEFTTKKNGTKISHSFKKSSSIKYETTLAEIGREIIREDISDNVGGPSEPDVAGEYILEWTASTDYGPFDAADLTNDVNGSTDSSASVDVSLHKVRGGAYCGTDQEGNDVKYDVISEKDYKVLDEDGVYLFEGEKKEFIVDTETDSSTNPSYTFLNWTEDGADAGKKSKQSVTMGTNEVVLKALFGKLDLNMTPKTVTAKAGEDTDPPVEYEFTGYTNDDETDVAGVYFDGKKLSATSVHWGGINGFYITVPDGTSEGIHTVMIKMNAANGSGEHVRKINVDNGEGIDLNSTVAVTYKMTIPVNKFVSPADSTKTVNAEVSGDAASYAKLRKSGSKNDYKKIDNESVADILLYGDTASGGAEKSSFKLTCNGTTDTAKVTVFPWPVLELNTSSSSSDSSLNSSSSSTTSSATSPFKVVMPAGVYHDNYMWSDVKKAKLVFTTSDKSKEATLDISSTDKYTRSATVNSLAVTSILNDICTESSQDVKVTVYPMNGSDYDRNIDDSKTITAYKITLDGSGGAKYTVNGTEMKDYFYAVKGTTYTIKSTSGNGEKFTKWEGIDFSGESGGSLRAEGSRTIKAVYGGSSSSSSSSSKNGAAGDNADDYDDVPKTGESKADIWILWSVLLISILGAGFMIYKRFGLVRAIAEADEEVAIAEHRERVEAEKKEEENKMNMLKSLRNLK